MSENFIDYYSILGVWKNATLQEIKSAYRKLAKKYHPDVSNESGAHEKFITINEAYLILSNEPSRSEYDFIYSQYFSSNTSHKNNIENIIYDFKKTQQKAKEKSYEIARLSLKEIFDLIKDGSRDASFQMINVLLYTVGAFLLYNSVQIFFVENPDYLKSIICFVFAIPIYFILQKRKF